MIIRLPTQKGVTLIELLISIAIFAIVASIVLFGFVGSRKHSDLRLAADTLANDLRRVQSSAIAGQEINGTVPGGFGMSFDLSGTNYKQYQLFSDTIKFNGSSCVAGLNQRNDRVLGPTCPDPQFSDSPIKLPGNVLIDTVYIGAVAITSGVHQRADIVFTTPEAVVHTHYGNTFNSYNPALVTPPPPPQPPFAPVPPTNQIVVICLKHIQLNQFRKITLIGATGQINVGNTATTCTP